jgi:hypothetical protein
VGLNNQTLSAGDIRTLQALYSPGQEGRDIQTDMETESRQRYAPSNGSGCPSQVQTRSRTRIRMRLNVAGNTTDWGPWGDWTAWGIWSGDPSYIYPTCLQSCTSAENGEFQVRKTFSAEYTSIGERPVEQRRQCMNGTWGAWTPEGGPFFYTYHYMGNFDGFRYEDGHYYAFGWICAFKVGQADIRMALKFRKLNLYVDFVPGVRNEGNMLQTELPEVLPAESAIAEVCQVPEGNYRFKIKIPNSEFEKYVGREITLARSEYFGSSEYSKGASGRWRSPIIDVAFPSGARILPEKPILLPGSPSGSPTPAPPEDPAPMPVEDSTTDPSPAVDSVVSPTSDVSVANGLVANPVMDPALSKDPAPSLTPNVRTLSPISNSESGKVAGQRRGCGSVSDGQLRGELYFSRGAEDGECLGSIRYRKCEDGAYSEVINPGPGTVCEPGPQAPADCALEIADSKGSQWRLSPSNRTTDIHACRRFCRFARVAADFASLTSRCIAQDEPLEDE